MSTQVHRGVILESALESLNRQFPGETFSPRRLMVGRGSDLQWVYHEFDAVSDDGRIVGLIDDKPWLTRSGQVASARVAELYQKLYLLGLTSAQYRLLVFTDRDSFLGFGRESDGKLGPGTKLIYAAANA